MMKNRFFNSGLTLPCVVLMMSCAACSSEISDLSELRELCEKDGGLTIYKSVQANGYYDASQKGGVLRELVPSNYTFVEFCNHESSRPSLFHESGCWRLTKVPRTSGGCNELVDEALSKSTGFTYPEFKEQQCISVEKIEKPTARYSYHTDLTLWNADNGFSRFAKSTMQIKESENNELLSEYISYLYTRRPAHTASKSCYRIVKGIPSFKEADMMVRTLIPNKELQDER